MVYGCGHFFPMVGKTPCKIGLGVVHIWRPQPGGGGQSHVDACGRGGGGLSRYMTSTWCFLEHNATVPHWILDSISDGKLQEITRTSNIMIWHLNCCVVDIVEKMNFFFVDVHTGGGGSGQSGRLWTGGGGSKSLFFCGRHIWTTPYDRFLGNNLKTDRDIWKIPKATNSKYFFKNLHAI